MLSPRARIDTVHECGVRHDAPARCGGRGTSRRRLDYGLGRRTGASVRRGSPAVVESRAIEGRRRPCSSDAARSIHSHAATIRVVKSAARRQRAESRPTSWQKQQAWRQVGQRIRHAIAAPRLGGRRNPGGGLRDRNDDTPGGAATGPRADDERLAQTGCAAGTIVADFACADLVAVLQAGDPGACQERLRKPRQSAGRPQRFRPLERNEPRLSWSSD
jgi:hypothetical protein